ncbi:uncharacterized protein LOC128732443 [Sabethes cyaneus]|uniref:uncharacterized protein LOC128732443 n=1 Tax=Sabethes cyaneus TaxID=53552 RepID=UPI00237DFCBF|nr:uncharacterized protein LOC128732443 [Sabethes cyaneus]
MKFASCCCSLLLLLACMAAFATSQTVDDCIEIACRTYTEVNTLWCHRLPTYFCQCRPTPGGIWGPQVMPCADATVFSFRHQVCVHPDMRNEADCFTGTSPDEPDEEDLCLDPPALCGTYAEINELKCHEDSKRFCQCRPLTSNPAVYAPIAMPCAEETSFSFYHQTCTRDELWQDSCSA